MNAFTRMLNLEVPIVLAPFGGLSSVALTAAVSNGGGLGSYGLYGYSAERIHDTGAQLHATTDRPFALNLWLPTGTERDPDAIELDAARAAVAAFFDELGMPQPTPPQSYLPDFDDQLDAAFAVRPAALSFVFGVPPAAVVERARREKVTVIGTATTVDEARALAEGGVDVVVATGSEAAGHRVSFLEPAERSLVGTFALVPQIVDAIEVPVIAAGGIADRRGVAAAFALGADAVQIGTAFLFTQESAANDAHRNAIATTAAHDSVLTRAMSGRLARGASNRAIRAIEEADAIAPFPAQNWLTGQFRAEAGRRGLGELQSLWLGQSAALSHHSSAADLLAELVRGLPGL